MALACSQQLAISFYLSMQAIHITHFISQSIVHFLNIRCLSFVKQMYLDTSFSVYVHLNTHTKICLDTIDSHTLNNLYFETEGVQLTTSPFFVAKYTTISL
jgi:hypothetical protein